MINKSSVICIDLDDTIFKEIYFFRSGVFSSFNHFLGIKLPYDSEFLKLNSLWIEFIVKSCEISKEDVLSYYREHIPNIRLPEDSRLFLNKAKKNNIPIVLISDGRSITQRNKLFSLEIIDFFDFIVISEEIGSEKPCLNNFKKVEDFYGTKKKYLYIGDNTSKDFIGPNNLNWSTICLLDNGINIHPQNFNQDLLYLPKVKVSNLKEINFII